MDSSQRVGVGTTKPIFFSSNLDKRFVSRNKNGVPGCSHAFIIAPVFTHQHPLCYALVPGIGCPSSRPAIGITSSSVPVPNPAAAVPPNERNLTSFPRPGMLLLRNILLQELPLIVCICQSSTASFVANGPTHFFPGCWP